MNCQLILVRHAIAEDRDEFAKTGKPDAQRPITTMGQRRMQRSLRGLRWLVPEVDQVLTSPSLRAAQTAQMLALAYALPSDALFATELLAPGGATPESFLSWLVQQPPQRTRVLVGHEPELSQLASWLLAGATLNCLTLKKGGAICLGLPAEADPARGTLNWLATPAILRRLGSR